MSAAPLFIYIKSYYLSKKVCYDFADNAKILIFAKRIILLVMFNNQT